MKRSSPADLKRQYLSHAVETASPAGRLTMLYGALELDLYRADMAFEASDNKAINDNLVHAQEIILCLRDTIKPELWEGAAQMIALNNFFLTELIGANVHKDRARAAAVATLIRQVADAWRQAADTVAVSQTGSP